MNVSINRHTAAVLESVVGNLGDRLDRMVAVQMTAYPDHWTDAERREMAEQFLFSGRVKGGAA